MMGSSADRIIRGRTQRGALLAVLAVTAGTYGFIAAVVPLSSMLAEAMSLGARRAIASAAVLLAAAIVARRARRMPGSVVK